MRLPWTPPVQNKHTVFRQNSIADDARRERPGNFIDNRQRKNLKLTTSCCACAPYYYKTSLESLNLSIREHTHCTYNIILEIRSYSI